MNQSKPKNDDAVSPVIGVILMVAITVVLAAVVFVLVSRLGSGGESPPELSFQTEDSGGNYTVIRSEPDLDWSEFRVVEGDCDALPTGLVEAGDQITNCDGSLVLRHVPSETLVYRYP